MTDGVFADEVQNLRALGRENVATPVMDKVNDKAADMKADLEYTREHAQLGALQGVVVDADNTVIYDFNKEFGGGLVMFMSSSYPVTPRALVRQPTRCSVSWC